MKMPIEGATRQMAREVHIVAPATDAMRIETGMRIAKARKEAQLTQVVLAERVGMSRQAVVKWEAGQIMPRPGTLAKIAEVTGKTVLWLSTGLTEFDQTIAPPVLLKVVGEVAQGLWRDSSVAFVPYDLPVVPVFHPDFPSDAQHLYVVRDPDGRAVLTTNEYLHVVDVDALAPEHEDIVVVRRVDAGKTEYSIKRVLHLKPGPAGGDRWVVRSLHTDLAQWGVTDGSEFPISLAGQLRDGKATIEIIAVVIARWKPVFKPRTREN